MEGGDGVVSGGGGGVLYSLQSSVGRRELEKF